MKTEPEVNGEQRMEQGLDQGHCEGGDTVVNHGGGGGGDKEGLTVNAQEEQKELRADLCRTDVQLMIQHVVKTFRAFLSAYPLSSSPAAEAMTSVHLSHQGLLLLVFRDSLSNVRFVK